MIQLDEKQQKKKKFWVTARDRGHILQKGFLGYLTIVFLLGFQQLYNQ